MVSTEIIDRIAFVTMQNGKHFNCLSEEMCNALSEAIEEAYKAECVGIVIKAEVNKGVWSAGHDIHELPLDGRDPLAYDVPMEQLSSVSSASSVAQPPCCLRRNSSRSTLTAPRSTAAKTTKKVSLLSSRNAHPHTKAKPPTLTNQHPSGCFFCRVSAKMAVVWVWHGF